MNRYDFMALVVVNGANPNGDPLGGNIHDISSSEFFIFL